MPVSCANGLCNPRLGFYGYSPTKVARASRPCFHSNHGRDARATCSRVPFPVAMPDNIDPSISQPASSDVIAYRQADPNRFHLLLRAYPIEIIACFSLAKSFRWWERSLPNWPRSGTSTT